VLRRISVLGILATLLVLAAGCIAPAPPKPGKKLVKICVQPEYSLHVVSQKYAPLFRYLANQTGYDIRVVSAMSDDRYLPTLEAQEVDIGIQTALAYITLVKTRGAYPLVRMTGPDGSTSYRGLILARRNSRIEGIADMRGRTVAAPSRRSAGGFLAQALYCSQHGVNVNKDLRFLWVDTHEAVVRAVYQGKAELGFVREDALPLVENKIDIKKLKTIACTNYYPAWCAAAFANTPAGVAREISRAMLNLDRQNPEHREILDAIGIAGFQKASDSEYEAMRKEVDDSGLSY
jgi:phosphonate transport system substrate-binding protein